MPRELQPDETLIILIDGASKLPIATYIRKLVGMTVEQALAVLAWTDYAATINPLPKATAKAELWSIKTGADATFRFPNSEDLAMVITEGMQLKVSMLQFSLAKAVAMLIAHVEDGKEKTFALTLQQDRYYGLVIAVTTSPGRVIAYLKQDPKHVFEELSGFLSLEVLSINDVWVTAYYR